MKFALNTSISRSKIFFPKNFYSNTNLIFGRYFNLFNIVSTISIFSYINTVSYYLDAFLIISYITGHC